MNEVKETCPRCHKELKMVGRSGFCKNDKCTIYEVLFGESKIL